MRYPNTYQSIKRIILAEFLYLISVLIGLYYVLLGSWGVFDGTSVAVILPWILRAFCIVAAVIRILALGQAAIDEDTIRSAQRLSLIFLLVCILNTVLMPSITGTLSMLRETGELQEEITRYCMFYLVLYLAELGLSFSSIVSFIDSLLRIANREKKADEIERIHQMKLIYTRLMVSAFAVAGLKLLLPDGMVPGNFFGALLGLSVIALILASWWLFLCFLPPMEDMLHRTAFKLENPWSGVARELRPAVLDLYDPDAGRESLPPPRLDWKPEHPWKGVARELLPESAEAPEQKKPAIPAYVQPVKAPRSVWAFDVERFFKDWNINLTKEDRATMGLRFPNVYSSIKPMIRAWNIFLAAVSLAMLLAVLNVQGLPLFSLGTAPVHWSVSLLAKASLWSFWCAYLRAPQDELTFLGGKKLISCTFWLAFILFIGAFYAMTFTKDEDMTILPYVIIAIRLLWLTVPFLLIANASSGFKRLSEKLGDWDAVPQWDKQRRFFTPGFFLVCGLLLLLLDQANAFLALPVYVFFVLLWIKLIRILKAEQDTLLQAKEAHSSAESGAAIDYSGKNTMETEPAE